MTGKHSFTREEQAAISLNLMQWRLATIAQWAAGLAGLFFSFSHGLPSVLLGLAGVALFHWAKPGPDPDLDRITGR